MVCNGNGETIGVALNFDAHDEPAVEITSKLVVVFDFLEHIEGPIRDQQLPQGMLSFVWYLLRTTVLAFVAI